MPGKPVGKDFDFFAEPGGRSRLPVRFGKHGYVFPFLGKFFEFCPQAVHHGVIHVIDGIPERAGHGRVVDILGSQPEMDEFLVVMQVQRIEFFFDEIFDSLYVVVGDFFNVLDFLCVFHREIAVDFAQLFKQVMVESCQLGQGDFAQGDEIFDFHGHAVADERAF